MKPFFPSRLAKIFFALIIGYFGVMHFMHVDIISGLIPEYIPGDSKIWVYLTGGCLIAAAIAILINKFKTPACYLLAFMLLIFVFTIHLQPAMEGNPGQLLKDTALAMAAIMIGNGASK